MSDNVYSPSTVPNTVKSVNGEVLEIPAGWSLLPPGDAALTRRVKLAGEHWIVQEKRGRKVFSRGIWAPENNIARVREQLASERATESYAKRKAADSKRREKVQQEYVDDFFQTVLDFLGFHERFRDMAEKMARAITEHATPVGSGTVARTKRISVEKRAEAATIAWMRHQTTGYDNMKIARVKGERREVRRMLAQRSRILLDSYRKGESVDNACPLAKALGHEETP
jgi:hypothetical protein